MRKDAVNASDVLCFVIHEGLDRRGVAAPIFSTLADDDSRIDCCDPCRQFIPVSELADPNAFDGLFNLYKDEPEEEMVAPQNLPKVIDDFTEVERCGCFDGRISVAIIDTEKGLILIDREETSAPEVEYIADEDYDYYPKRIRGRREYSFNPNDEPSEKRGWKKPCRENLKTMPERKVQRSNRALLAQVKVRQIEDRNFFDVAALLSDQLIDFALSSEPFEGDEFDA